MTTQRFSHTQYPINSLVEQIDSGELSLPDLQRPFVWNRSRVRDLFDSLYHGYPAGYFLFWSTPAAVDSHSVATAGGKSQVLKMIVDGQQRLTSLYAVLKAKDVVTEDNELQQMRISFNPFTEEFAVADAARANDPEWLTSISDIWNSPKGEYGFISSFIKGVRENRGLTDDEEQLVGERLGHLAGLKNYQFSALELSADLDIDDVAEVFVRINSAGIDLNSADFILTLMSVHVKDARHELEDFAREAKLPSTKGASPYNHFHTPSPDQLLRVAVGLGLKRGVLQNAYQALRGRDPKTKEVSEERREDQFAKLLAAQEHVLDLTNWADYMVAVKRAGYRSGDMLTSKNNFLYCYLFFLMGRHEYGVGKSELREAIARWFFMASLTGRYTGSPETILEADLRRFSDAETADDFVAILDGVIDTQLTSDFWDVTLPDLLDSSAAWSPYLFGYYASLNLLEAKALFSNMKISELFDPGVKQTKSPVERHHLFPKAYLSSIGITGTTRTNQICNFAFVEWADNIAIADTKPAEYFPEYFSKLPPSDQEQARSWHALPPEWEHMEYFEFLRERRKRMAKVVEKGFERLRSGVTRETKQSHEATLPTVSDLLRHMETNRVEFKMSARAALENDVPEKVINEGVVKTVAAFLNSSGGTLAIGITDDGDICGIQPDLDYKHQDLDGYQNWLTTLLVNNIGGGAVGAHAGIRLEAVGSEVVCLVDVSPSPVPVYAKTTKGDACFYVRMNNTTRMLEGPDLPAYIDGHWKK
ncbi:MAG: GmrSD restriction endonuclease domain-containing protein [Acidimicrobiia bacterium]